MMQRITGLIIKGVGGRYQVRTEQGDYDCAARGILRKSNISPVAGDRVVIELEDESKGIIAEVCERKNVFIRPKLANLDQLFLVVSVCQPVPSSIVIDKLIAVCEHKQVEPVLVITKTDLGERDSLTAIYQKAGFCVFAVSNQTGENVDQVRAYIQSQIGDTAKIAALAGNSGVGKSSLLNALFPDLALQTAQISQKLGRGKHTTRQVELYPIGTGSYLADTPGFGAMETDKYERILKQDLQDCFREFAPYVGKCQFTGCSHTTEKGCAVLQALHDGKIANERHQNYLTMYQEAKNINEWE